MLFLQFFQGNSCGVLLGTLLTGAGTLTNHLIVQQHLGCEQFVMVGAGLTHQTVAQNLIFLLLHQFLQRGLIVQFCSLVAGTLQSTKRVMIPFAASMPPSR